MIFSANQNTTKKPIQILTFLCLSDDGFVNVQKFVQFNGNKSQLIVHLVIEI